MKTHDFVCPEMLTRSFFSGEASKKAAAASAFTLDASFSSGGFLDGTGQATQDGSTTTTKGIAMKTTTTTQNQNPKRGRDLGQIIQKAYFYPGNVEHKAKTCWLAVVINKDGHEFLVADGEERDKSRLIDYGYKFKDGYRNNPTSAFGLCLILADLTSKSKFDRDYAKERVRELVEIGQAIMVAAQAAIDAAKAEEQGRV